MGLDTIIGIIYTVGLLIAGVIYYRSLQVKKTEEGKSRRNSLDDLTTRICAYDDSREWR